MEESQMKQNGDFYVISSESSFNNYDSEISVQCSLSLVSVWQTVQYTAAHQRDNKTKAQFLYK